MSFRKEIKFCLDKSKKHQFLKWIENQGAKKLHEERIINSIYFDNNNLLMYHDSIEGVVPRKKIRLRNYNEKNDYLIEKKISSPEGRFKISKKTVLHNQLLTKGILDNQYGLCGPKIIVSYLRNYFLFKNFRITLDKNISYSKFNINYNSNFVYKDDELVVEVKGNNLDQDFFDQHFPFVSSRFSKYCRGIDIIFNK